jgi:hypothetical protein
VGLKLRNQPGCPCCGTPCRYFIVAAVTCPSGLGAVPATVSVVGVGSSSTPFASLFTFEVPGPGTYTVAVSGLGPGMVNPPTQAVEVAECGTVGVSFTPGVESGYHLSDCCCEPVQDGPVTLSNKFGTVVLEEAGGSYSGCQTVSCNVATRDPYTGALNCSRPVDGPANLHWTLECAGGAWVLAVSYHACGAGLPVPAAPCPPVAGPFPNCVATVNFQPVPGVAGSCQPLAGSRIPVARYLYGLDNQYRWQVTTRTSCGAGTSSTQDGNAIWNYDDTVTWSQ